jgi:hypothetical protein
MQETPWYTRARQLGREGRAADALAELRAGLAAGAWYNPEALVTEPDLASVRSHLAPILHECDERRRLRRAETRPLCLVLSPSGALWDQQTLFLLHVRGDTARGFTNLWRPLVDEGWTLVVPQSSQPLDSASWCWDDLEAARREVMAHLEDCRTKRGLDPARIVVAGAGQGGRLAAEVGAETGMPWLCVDPDFPRDYDYRLLNSVPGSTRGVFLLSGASLPVPGMEVRTFPGIGPDFARHAAEALRLLEFG